MNSKVIRLISLCLCVGLLGCPRSDEGQPLFEGTPVPQDFLIPAGQASFQTFVIAQPRIVTGFADQLDALELSVDDVDAVGGLRARITSLDGQDFREIERIELRVCPASDPGCTQIDIMFSVSDLTGRRQDVVNLNPGLRNFKPLFVDHEALRVELVIFPFNVTTQTIEARLEWTWRAVGGLD